MKGFLLILFLQLTTLGKHVRDQSGCAAIRAALDSGLAAHSPTPTERYTSHRPYLCSPTGEPGAG